MVDVPEEKFPTVKPAGSDAEMFIQWKGTEVCLDFYCPCGMQGHVDADFTYYLRCPACDTTYELGTQVIVKKFEGTPRLTPVDIDISA